MEQNTYIEKYRRESIILDGNRNGSDLNQPLIPGNQSNLNSHLLQLLGGDKGSSHPGHYLAPGNQWVPGRIPDLRKQITELEKRFEEHTLSELKMGNVKPKAWPDDLRDKKQRAEARLEIALEEKQELQRLLDEAQEQQKRARPSLLTHPRHWGSSSLRHGVLVEIGPWRVSANSDGLLCIDDESSPYNTMPVHRFRAEVTKPMGMEFAHRNKFEETEAVRLLRPRKKVNWPKPPTWDKDSDLIEYKDYSNETIKKLKQEN